MLGWTPPAGRRTGIGALHVGYHDTAGGLHYAGGLGAGFTDAELTRLRALLDLRKLGSAPDLLVAGEAPDKQIRWVRPELVAEAEYTGWSGAGRLRHDVYLGLREDKCAVEVVRAVPDDGASRAALVPRVRSGTIVVARTLGRRAASVAGVELSHADRELWPGVTKADLGRYWLEAAEWALPGIARRPLAILRCPEGIGGETFFQKHGNKGLPPDIREGQAGGQPFLSVDGVGGLAAMAQLSAIELHSWGAGLFEPLQPDRLVFDLDPGEGVGMPEIVRAAHDVRNRLGKLDLASFCRTSGGKGLHVVAPLRPSGGWDPARAFARAFAERMATDAPGQYVATVRKSLRSGRILIDWLRNGLGATAVASFVPRARPGAVIATPLAWREVTAKLDPAAYTIHSVPGRLARLRRDPWAGFTSTDQQLPKGMP